MEIIMYSSSTAGAAGAGYAAHAPASTPARTSPGTRARVAGGLWLVVIVTGMFAVFAFGSLIVNGDAAGTAAKIRGSDTLFRLAFAANLVAGLCYMGVTVLLYDLFKPVGRSASLLAASFGAAGVTAGAAASLFSLAPLALLGDAPYLGAFTAAQLEALSQVALRLAGQGSQIGMVFFGCQCFLVGCLIVRSSLVPRIIGAVLAVGGFSYVANALAFFVSPAVGAQLSPFVMPAVFLGEGSLSLWLLARGVNTARWQEQAARS
jgi:hypothetical protein